MARRRKIIGLNDPLRLLDHGRPRTRREMLGQGFTFGSATLLGGSIFSLFGNPRKAYAALSPDIDTAVQGCGIVGAGGAGKIPFICFDLAGGANFAGSNVLVGGAGGQEDFLSTAGYNKLGLPGDRTPNITNPNTGTNDFVDRTLDLAFHSESQLLAGILQKASLAAPNVSGAVIPARSQNDTGNNPHNPMYAINLAGADGEVVGLIGSSNSDSGGNSMAPVEFMMAAGPDARPTKVDRPSDVTGLVDIGDLAAVLSTSDTVAAMESMYRLSDQKLGVTDTGLSVAMDTTVKDLVRCGYLKSTFLADRFGGIPVDPAQDPEIVGPAGVFSQAEFDSDREFRKAASVMKMVVNGYAGAGTITMGGYDYHTGDRMVGEARDLRAGRCIGACLEYARIIGVPLMIYVCSDGSVFSNGMVDNSAANGPDDPGGQSKLVWTGDNQQTACSFFLVYNPTRRPTLMGATPEEQAVHQQIGYFRASGDVETNSSPAANSVYTLVQTVLLNYMALHGQQGGFQTLLSGNSIASALSTDQLDTMTAFTPIVNGTITNPV